jgi:hypothetical protein
LEPGGNYKQQNTPAAESYCNRKAAMKPSKPSISRVLCSTLANTINSLPEHKLNATRGSPSDKRFLHGKQAFEPKNKGRRKLAESLRP